MEEKSSFDSLVSDLSPAERKDMLEKMQGQEDIPQENGQSAPAEVVQEASLDAQLKNESLFLRFWLWLKSLFTNTPVETLFNEYRVDVISRNIARVAPNLIDARKKLLLTTFFNKISELKKSADFFKPYCASVESKDAEFYVILGAVAMPQIEQQMASDVDPYSIPLERGAKPDQRVSLLRRMDEVLAGIPTDQKTVMYACARAAAWLVQFVKLPFNRFLSQFNAMVEGEFTCQFGLATEEVRRFARVLCHPLAFPQEVFEALYRFYRSNDVRVRAENPDDDDSAEAFAEKAQSQLALLETFIDTVPLHAIGCVVRNDCHWSPEPFTGAEDWFVKYKQGWKKLFDQKWEAWSLDCKKEVIRQRLQKDFGLERFPLLPLRPWEDAWGDLRFRYELTAGFLCWYFREKFPAHELLLKTVMTEGDFIKKENRAEFTETFNAYVQISVELGALQRNTEPSGELGAFLEKLKTEHTLLAVQKGEQLLRKVEGDFGHLLYSFGEASRKMILLLEGIVGLSTDSRYDSIANYSTIQGRGNEVFRKNLNRAHQSLRDAYDMIKELEPVDSPPNQK